MNKGYIYKRRLLALADFLNKLPKDRFDYSTWVGSDWEGKPNLSCGTTACAFGWATVMPSLRKLGLKLDHYTTSVVLENNRETLNSAGAAREVFGLSLDEFNYLFLPTGRPLHKYGLNRKSVNMDASSKQAAKHIRKFAEAKYVSSKKK